MSLRHTHGLSENQFYYLGVIACGMTVLLPLSLAYPAMNSESIRLWPALEMLRSNEWIVPTLGGETYINKPPLLYWLIAGVFFAGGGPSLAAARLVNIFLTIGTAIYCGRMLGSDARERTIISLCYLLSLGTITQSCLATIDPLLANSFSATLASFFGYSIGRISKLKCILLSGVALAVGFLSKGPILLPFVVLAGLIPDKWWADKLQIVLVSSLIAAAIFLVWAIPLLTQIDSYAALKVAAFEVSVRFAQLGWSKWALLVQSAFDFMPWILLFPSMVRYYLTGTPGTSRLAVRFAFFALLCEIAMFSLPGYQDQYALPFSFAFSMFAGVFLVTTKDYQYGAARVLYFLAWVSAVSVAVVLARYASLASAYGLPAMFFASLLGSLVLLFRRSALFAGRPIKLGLICAVIVVSLNIFVIAPTTIMANAERALDHAVPRDSVVMVPRKDADAFLYALFYVSKKHVSFKVYDAPRCDGHIYIIPSDKLGQMAKCATALTAYRMDSSYRWTSLKIAIGLYDTRNLPIVYLVRMNVRAK